MSKDKNKKSTCTKNRYPLTAADNARLAGCSISYVKKLRAGLVNRNSPKARVVLALDDLASRGTDVMMSELEKLTANV